MTRTNEPRTSRRCRPLRMLARATLAAGAAIMIGLSGAGATFAFLTATATAPGATLTAGTLGLQLNGASSASLGAFAVSPSTPVAKAFSVRNTGDAPATLAAEIKASSTPAISSRARVRITQVPNSTTCTTGLAGTQEALDGYSATLDGGSLAAGAIRWFCFEVALAAATPVTVSGQGFGFDVTVNGRQSTN